MNFLKDYENKLLTGKQLREIFGEYSEYFIKFTNENDKHFDMVYKTGLNVDIKPFNPHGSNMEGGIYFFHLFDCFEWIYLYGEYARKVDLVDDMQIYVEKGKVKTDKIVVGPKHEKQVLITDMLEKAFKMNPVKTNEIMLDVVRNNPFEVKFIDEKFRTHEMMLEAVKNNGLAIKVIDQKFRTLEMMMEAVKKCGIALQYIPEEFRTKEMIDEAVKNDIDATMYLSDIDAAKYLPKGQNA